MWSSTPVTPRYISVLVFIIGNYVQWGGATFSESFCRGFWFLPAVFKCMRLPLGLRRLIDVSRSPGLQAMVVQVILGWRYGIPQRRQHALHPSLSLRRTYKISRSNKRVLYPLVVLYVLIVPVSALLFVDLGRRSNPSPRCNGLRAFSIATVRDRISPRLRMHA